MNEGQPLIITHTQVLSEPKKAITLQIHGMAVTESTFNRWGTGVREGTLTEGLRIQLEVAVKAIADEKKTDINHIPADPDANSHEILIIRSNGRTIVSSRPTRLPLSSADKDLLHKLEFARTGTKPVSYESSNGSKP